MIPDLDKIPEFNRDLVIAVELKANAANIHEIRKAIGFYEGVFSRAKKSGAWTDNMKRQACFLEGWLGRLSNGQNIRDDWFDEMRKESQK